VAGDVVTAQTAGTGVTQADAGQQDQTEHELPAAEDRVASAAAAPGPAGQPASASAASRSSSCFISSGRTLRISAMRRSDTGCDVRP